MAELVGAGEVNRCGPCWKMPSYNAAGCLRFGLTDRRRDGLREEDGCRVVPNLKFRIYFTTSRNMPEKKKTNRNATKKQNLWRDFYKDTDTQKKLFLWHRFDYVYSILDSPFSLLKLENCAIEKHSNNRSPNSNNRSPISNICLRFQITVPWFQTTVPRFQVSGDRAFFEYWPKKGETRILKHVGRRFMSRNRIKQKID